MSKYPRVRTEEDVTLDAIEELVRELEAEGIVEPTWQPNVPVSERTLQLTPYGSQVAREHGFPDTLDGISQFLIHLGARKYEQKRVHDRLSGGR